jgi:Rrf2 family transcriptional regulator, iron-sulfur cluster assembly transcription factor
MRQDISLLPRRALLALAAVVDVALHARPTPVAAKALAHRHNLPPRHLETLLQDLVRMHILKGVRGPKGGYELARERRRITVGEIVRAALSNQDNDFEHNSPSHLIETVVKPRIANASSDFLAALDGITIEELCQSAQITQVPTHNHSDFTI